MLIILTSFNILMPFRTTAAMLVHVVKERLGIGENTLHLLSLRMSKKCQVCVCVSYM